jgi:transposase-like protein
MKYTIKTFNEEFPDDAACLDYIFDLRFPDGGACPCGKKDGFYRVAKRKCYSCSACGFQLSPTEGTIFHKSKTSLKSWLFAMFLITTSKNGVSAKELQRQIGVTYKCAWRMAHQIRKLMNPDGGLKMSGIVEADETYIGGVRKGKRGRGAANKSPIVGLLERGGNLQVRVTENCKAKSIIPNMVRTVEQGTLICTDEFNSYNGVTRAGFEHKTVKHSAKEYVNGVAHTNGIDGFWSQLKRSVNGTFHWISRKYLPAYVDEFVYRYNLRESGLSIFEHLSQRVAEMRG